MILYGINKYDSCINIHAIAVKDDTYMVKHNIIRVISLYHTETLNARMVRANPYTDDINPSILLPSVWRWSLTV